jgi:virginiamycin A acetyltransferase
MAAHKQLKRAFKTLALLLILPIFFVYRGLAMLGNPDSTFQSFSQLLSLIPGKIGIYVRASFYHLACPDTSQNISIGFLTLLSHRDTTIEDGVYIGPQSNIGSCHIGKNTLIGSGVHILSGKNQHRFSDPRRSIQEQGGEIQKIKIGEDCWIGNKSTILAPISDKSIVAAASLVLETVSPEMIVGGHPAKVIKSRNNDSMSK